MRIAVVDESSARAAVIEEGLRDAGLTDITVFADRQGIAARLEALSPDVVLINLANPHRDELEELFALSKAMARPVAMFVDQSDAADTPVLIASNVSLPNERIIRTRIDLLPLAVDNVAETEPALILIGEVVRAHRSTCTSAVVDLALSYFDL